MLFDEVDPVRRWLARGFRCKRYREFEAPRSRFAENEKMLTGLRRKRGPYFFDGALLSENVLLLGGLDRGRRLGFFRTGAIAMPETSAKRSASRLVTSVTTLVCDSCSGGWRRRFLAAAACPVFRLDDDGRIGFLCRFVAPENHVTYPGCVSGRITYHQWGDTAAPGRPLVTDCRTAIMAAP